VHGSDAHFMAQLWDSIDARVNPRDRGNSVDDTIAR
jgi:hypothetical protein